MNSITLYNGLDVPAICYGSSIVYSYAHGKNMELLRKIKYCTHNLLYDRKQIRKDLAYPRIIDTAIAHGINMFDTSRAYGGSEWAIGKAVKRYNRNDFLIVTKIDNWHQLRNDVLGGFCDSLNQLKLDSVDVLLMHWPVDEVYVQTWKQMIDLYNKGLCKAIGVCNCNKHHIERLIEETGFVPMINQIECHPLFTQNELREYCQSKNIQIMAYTSTARMDERLKKTIIVPIAKKYNKSVAQVILRWHQQIGNIPVVNTSNAKHLIENANIFDFELTKKEVSEITAVNISSRLRYDPDNCDFTKL